MRYIFTALVCTAAILFSFSAVEAQDSTPVIPPTEAEAAAEAEAQQPEGPDLSDVNKRILAAEYDKADELLVEIQEEFPESLDVAMTRGEVLLALGKAEEALPQLEKVAAAEPDRSRLQFQIASARLAAGDTDGALEAFAAEVANGKDAQATVLAHLNRAMLLQRSRKWDEAAADLEGVLALEPTRQEVYGDLASLYLRSGRLDDAQRVLDTGFEAGFQSAAHFYSLGARIFKAEEYERAVAVFQRALELDPKHARSERSLGAALDKLGRKDEAKVHFKRYLELNPTAADAAKIRDMVTTGDDS